MKKGKLLAAYMATGMEGNDLGLLNDPREALSLFARDIRGD